MNVPSGVEVIPRAKAALDSITVVEDTEDARFGCILNLKLDAAEQYCFQLHHSAHMHASHIHVLGALSFELGISEKEGAAWGGGRTGSRGSLTPPLARHCRHTERCLSIGAGECCVTLDSPGGLSSSNEVFT